MYMYVMYTTSLYIYTVYMLYKYMYAHVYFSRVVWLI